MDELTQLLAQAASSLSGYPVSVRWRAPSRADARAVCFKSGGRAVIDLHPGLEWDGAMLLYVIAHESAHIRELYPEWSNLPDLPSGSVRFCSRALRSPVVTRIESTADAQAKAWLAYAKRCSGKYYQAGDDNFTAELRALANWRE